MGDNGLFLIIIVGLVTGILFVSVISAIFGPMIGIFAGYFGLIQKTVSADNFEKNYEYFKQQEMALSQMRNQICYEQKEIDRFEKSYGSTINWTRSTKNNYEDLQFVKRGYVSKYNSLAAEYNAKRSSFIQAFGRDSNLPREYAEFFETDCD